MTKTRWTGFGEGARESVSRQNAQVDDDMDISSEWVVAAEVLTDILSEWVVAAVEMVLTWSIGRVGNMLDLEVVGNVR
jgi:hypothetical protein